jgi:hypothetical protein
MGSSKSTFMCFRKIKNCIKNFKKFKNFSSFFHRAYHQIHMTDGELTGADAVAAGTVEYAP